MEDGVRRGRDRPRLRAGVRRCTPFRSPSSCCAVYFPAPDVEEQPLVSQPVIGATLLKLGKPMDPKKLPDRLVPKQSTAPHPEVKASQEDPLHKNEKPDAGPPPPPDAKDSDIQKLIAKSDPFAEDAGKERPVEGFANGSDAGAETDPSRVHAGDQYAAMLQKFFQDRWQIPTVISAGESGQALRVPGSRSRSIRGCAVWFVNPSPDKPSGNDLFDDSARSMLQKLVDDHTALPDPPPEIAETFRSQRIQLKLGKRGCR